MRKKELEKERRKERRKKREKKKEERKKKEREEEEGKNEKEEIRYLCDYDSVEYIYFSRRAIYNILISIYFAF